MHNSCTFIFNINKKKHFINHTMSKDVWLLFFSALTLFFLSWTCVQYGDHFHFQPCELSSLCACKKQTFLSLHRCPAPPPPHFTTCLCAPQRRRPCLSLFVSARWRGCVPKEISTQERPAALPQHSSPSFSAYHSRPELFSLLWHTHLPLHPPAAR